MLKLQTVKRREPLKRGSLLVLPAALAVSLALSLALLWVQGKPPLRGLLVIVQGAFGAGYAVEDTLLKAVPIYLCALGVAVTFRMRIWNIGAEGQYGLGAIGATWAALTFSGQPAWVLIPLMMAASAAAGLIWAAIPALLKLRLKVNEIITTLMLNYVAILFLDWLVYGPWKDPISFGFPMTEIFPEAAQVGAIPGLRLHWGILLCIAAGLATALFFGRTRLGFELKASGEAPDAARYARMPYSFLVFFVMAVGGALSGWAGFLEVSAVVGRLQPSIMVSYGYTAIVVAWLARLKPGAIAVAAVLLAALRVGVENLQLEMQVPAAYGLIMQGLILLSVLAAQFFQFYRFRIEREAGGPA
jgi:simple sugar transport system permease protein